ncbi:MAG: AbrB/MazE/SpoVT family DNA-binding domain-containing protein [Patescibacteria group bacterium]|nr:AbrB/MazE/SpoVT family DNA-binding domain-containing protein [Patescibacteria group bacterium]
MTKQNNQSRQKKFYGAASLGEKGQIVIPSDARKDMNLKKGDRLLVFGTDKDMVVLMKLSQVEKIASHLSEKLKMFDEVINKTK